MKTNKIYKNKNNNKNLANSTRGVPKKDEEASSQSRIGDETKTLQPNFVGAQLYSRYHYKNIIFIPTKHMEERAGSIDHSLDASGHRMAI